MSIGRKERRRAKAWRKGLNGYHPLFANGKKPRWWRERVLAINAELCRMAFG